MSKNQRKRQEQVNKNRQRANLLFRAINLQ